MREFLAHFVDSFDLSSSDAPDAVLLHAIVQGSEDCVVEGTAEGGAERRMRGTSNAIIHQLLVSLVALHLEEVMRSFRILSLIAYVVSPIRGSPQSEESQHL